MSVATFDARVIGAFGRQVRVRTADGAEYPARPLGRTLGIVCGDEVRCRHDERHGEVHVLEVLPRRTALYRTDTRGRAEAVLANLTRLLVVIAPVPEPDLFVADRYLAAAASAGIEPILIVNKADLGIDAALGASLGAYRRADTPCIEVSAVSGAGEAELLAACRGRTAVRRRQILPRRAACPRRAHRGRRAGAGGRRAPHHHCIATVHAACGR
jgi:ribosome biogenesis GTPase